ncbi:hypothetical protein L1987_27932 [Smallanthus sonchifolius]|uniref:Uncharacterized protein n=1 Tax=Smallanthus sonchifolius TaxID=185202 RepID=A0ACB9IBY5_9ASTR|nr:hypothetical protein L1987_27932 [Smallanthus sonchifolius]
MSTSSDPIVISDSEEYTPATPSSSVEPLTPPSSPHSSTDEEQTHDSVDLVELDSEEDPEKDPEEDPEEELEGEADGAPAPGGNGDVGEGSDTGETVPYSVLHGDSSSDDGSILPSPPRLADPTPPSPLLAPVGAKTKLTARKKSIRRGKRPAHSPDIAGPSAKRARIASSDTSSTGESTGPSYPPPYWLRPTQEVLPILATRSRLHDADISSLQDELALTDQALLIVRDRIEAAEEKAYGPGLPVKHIERPEKVRLERGVLSS